MARRIGAALLAVAGAAVAAHLGRGAVAHLRQHHNEMFVGHGSVWYNRLSPVLIGKLYRRVAREAAASLQAGIVLDVGCGSGHLALELARCQPGLAIRGVDISADMVQRAIENAMRHGLSERVGFDVSKPTRLPYQDASIDLVVSTLSMHHWEDVPAMLRELGRVIRPGRQVWIYDVYQPAMSPAGLAEAVPEGLFSEPRLEPGVLWIGPIRLRRFVRCTLLRR